MSYTGYKLKVNSAYESERIQDAFMRMGGYINIINKYRKRSEPYLDYTKLGFRMLYLDSNYTILHGKSVAVYEAGHEQEVSIFELEEIALSEEADKYRNTYLSI